MNDKYPFRQSWFDNLIKHYTKRPGQSLIGLDDLPDKIYIYFSFEAKSKIIEKIFEFYSGQTEQKLIRTFGWGLINYIKGKQQSISLGTLRQLTKKLKLNLENLEKHVVKIKPSSSSKIIQIKLPLNMMNKEGAIVLGVFPDVGIGRYVLSCKDKELVDEFRNASQKLLGFFKDKNPQNKNGMNRYYATNFLRDICDIAGYDTSKKQIIGNNAIPLWIFSSRPYFLKLYLKKIWDTDGTLDRKNKRLKFAQSVGYTSKLLSKFIRSNGDIRFKNLSKQFREIILRKPPFLIISLQLLLSTMGIKSKIYPERVKRFKDGLASCEWSLRICSYSNIKTFAEKIGFGLKRKEKILLYILSSYREVKIKEKYLSILNSVKRNGNTTIYDSAKVIGLSMTSARFYLMNLQRNGFISYKIGELIRGTYRPQGFIYELTEKGKNFLDDENEHNNMV